MLNGHFRILHLTAKLLKVVACSLFGNEIFTRSPNLKKYGVFIGIGKREILVDAQCQCFIDVYRKSSFVNCKV
ncbi:unnamed protein product [Trifolium pratense]|uniref:Uncharacterized protein n=1 Tax=Trifolium pratense TaxID=57577 RepID=A0ACB0LXH6_TRIPR|nr:unnamed protein product [Trifolium pratense]